MKDIFITTFIAQSTDYVSMYKGEIKMIIIDLIRELMYQQKITIGYLAKKSGLPYEVVENVVDKKIVPSPENAKIILEALGVKLEDVLCLY